MLASWATHPGRTASARDRFAEFLTLLDELLREPQTDFQGHYYAAEGARQIPGCVQRPRLPFAVAANGPRGMELTARLGRTWVMVDGRGEPEELIPRLDEACTQKGREPASLDRLALVGFRDTPLDSLQAYQDTAGRYEALGFSDFVVHWPRREGPFAAEREVLERVAAEVLGR